MEKNDVAASSAVLDEDKTVLQKIPFWSLTVLLVLTPLFVIPSSSVEFLFSKMLLVTFFVLLTACVSLLNIAKNGKINLLNWKTLVAVGVVPLFTLIASILSIYRPMSFLGVGSEFDTLHFIALGFLLMLLVAVNFQSKQRVFWSYVAIIAAFILLSIFHIIRFFGGAGVLGFNGVFGSMVSNTVGSWNDVAIFSGLVTILSFITIEFFDMGKKLKYIFYAPLAFGLIMLAVTNFFVITSAAGVYIPLTTLVGIIALFSFVYIITNSYKTKRKNPIASLIVLVVCLILTIGVNPITMFINSKIGVTQEDVLNVRPTLYGTYTVSKDFLWTGGVVKDLFGVGPNRFSVIWSLFRPADVNQTLFWNTDFNYGESYIFTTLVTTGILGFLAWLYFLGALAWVGISAAFGRVKDKFSTYLLVSSLLSSLYFWVLALISTLTTSTLILAFFFSGLLMASLIREKVIKTTEYGWSSNQKKSFVAVLVLILSIVALVAWGYDWSERMIASTEIDKAQNILQSPSDLPQAESLVASAVRMAPTIDVYWRSFADLKMTELQVTMQQNQSSQLSTSTANLLQQAMAAVQNALQINPIDYHNYLFAGQIYQVAGTLGVSQAGDTALAAYKQAALYIPSSPLPAYYAGYLLALAGDTANAEAALKQALTLKPDFQEAQTLYNQLQKTNPTAGVTGTSKSTQTASSTTSISTKKTSTTTAASTTKTK